MFVIRWLFTGLLMGVVFALWVGFEGACGLLAAVLLFTFYGLCVLNFRG